MVARGRRIAAANADPLPALPSDVQPLLPGDARQIARLDKSGTKRFLKGKICFLSATTCILTGSSDLNYLKIHVNKCALIS